MQKLNHNINEIKDGICLMFRKKDYEIIMLLLKSSQGTWQAKSYKKFHRNNMSVKCIPP